MNASLPFVSHNSDLVRSALDDDMTIPVAVLEEFSTNCYGGLCRHIIAGAAAIAYK